MTIDEALEFLECHAPLPSDDSLSQADVDVLDDVRRFLLEHPDQRVIGPLLRVFGDGSGFGIYQLLENVLAQFPASLVVPRLSETLLSPHRGVRYWSSQIASRFPDQRLVEALTTNLSDSDADIRAMAATALGVVGGETAQQMLRNRLLVEHDEEVRAAIQDALS